MKKTIKQYILENMPQGWSNKEVLEKAVQSVMQKDGHSAYIETIGRELRRLSEHSKDKCIERDEYKSKEGKNLVRYAPLKTVVEKPVINKPTFEMRDGKMVAVFHKTSV